MINILQHKQRFPLSKVFLVTLAFSLSFYIIDMWLSLAMPTSYPFVSFKKWLIIREIIGLVFDTFFYYFLLNSYYKMFYGKKKFVHFLRITIIACIFLIIYIFGFEKLKSPDIIELKLSSRIIIYTFFIAKLFIVGIIFLIAFLTYLRDEKKQRKMLEEQKMQLEIEKIHANYNFLKAQINPHFLHNTLNFLYAKSLPFSPELSEGILTLSEIMRYALGENNIKDGKAALKDEIEHMRNIIKIHQLRFENNLQVNFEVNGIVNGAAIIPFVLITIVENAFKHGNVKSAEHPIEIKLIVEHNSLHFYCHNKKKTGPRERSTGIGLDNIKKRLDLAYGNQYNLNIEDDTEFYTTQLTINQI